MTFLLQPTVAALVMLLLKATVLLVAALGASAVLQRASAGARHMVWVAIVGALLVLPALAAWSPLRLAILPASPAHTSAILSDLSQPGRSPEQEQASPTAEPNVVTTATPPASQDGANQPATISLWRVAAYVWLAVALAVVAWLAFGFLAVRRIVRRARPLEDRAWTAPLYEIADRLGIDATPRLLRSDAVKMPFACGLVAPTIILPEASEGWDLERRRAVLMHELAHIRRRDLVGHTLGRLVCAVYWFHPLVWTAVRRLRIESERACDDLALVCGLRPSSYAEHLLDIVSNVGRTRTPAIAIPMAHRREFEGRMLAILDPDVRRRVERRQSSAILAGLMLLVLVVGAAVPAERAVQLSEQRSLAAPLRADTAVSQDVTLGAAPAASANVAPRHTAARRQSAQGVPNTQQIQSAPPKVEHDSDVTLADLLGQDTTRDDRAALLIGVLRSDTSAKLRRVAAWGLANHAEREDVGSALAAAVRRDNSATVREMAAWALAHGNERPGAIEALADALRRDADIRVRETAAWALGNLDAETAVAALGDAASGPSVRLRKLALWALGNASPRQAPRAALDALADSEPSVRRLAAWALYMIEDPESVPALEQALSREQDRDLRMAYIRALGAIGERSSAALARLLESRDPDVRGVVVAALAGQGSGPWPWPWPNPRPFP